MWKMRKITAKNIDKMQEMYANGTVIDFKPC